MAIKMNNVFIGQRIKFDSDRGCHPYSQNPREKATTIGVVQYINEEHRYFVVEYGREHKLRTSFKFDDIGIFCFLLY